MFIFACSGSLLLLKGFHQLRQRELVFTEVLKLLTAVASLVAEHGP